MTIYENNKQLLTTIGGNSDNYSTDYEVRKAILDALGGDSSLCSNIYEVDLQILKIFQEGGGNTGGSGGNTDFKLQVDGVRIDDSCIKNGTWEGYEYLDLSTLNSMERMFYGCKSLQTLDVSNWDTSNVTNMYNMFGVCTSLQSLDLSGWDTSNVTNIGGMFNSCLNIQSLDLSNWDTSNVTSMDWIFRKCSSLQSLDLSNWDTSNVTNMNDMFYGCSSLQSLDLSNWDTSNLVYTYEIFSYCDLLQTLIGGKTIDEVLSNNISTFNNLKSGITIAAINLDRASLRALINGLADLTGSTSQTIFLGSLKAKLKNEDIAVATAKNWTIS